MTATATLAHTNYEGEMTMSFDDRALSVLAQAKAIGDSVESWADFANAVLGHGGVLSRLFPDEMEHQAFLDTEQYQELGKIQKSLMEKFGIVTGANPKSGRFVVRIPRDALAAEPPFRE